MTCLGSGCDTFDSTVASVIQKLFIFQIKSSDVEVNSENEHLLKLDTKGSQKQEKVKQIKLGSCLCYSSWLPKAVFCWQRLLKMDQRAF